MRRFDTIATRTMALLLLGLGLFHLLSVWAYDAALDREVAANNEMRIVERLLAIRRSLATQPPHQRETLAHEMSGGPIDAHYGSKPLAVARVDDLTAATLRARLIAAEPELDKAGLVIGSETTTADRADSHQLVASLGLGDGTFVNVSVVKIRHASGSGHAAIWSTTLMAIGVILASLVVVRWITRPLRDLRAAARAIENAPHTERIDIAPVPETGPREVAETARAFNDMQRRIATLVEDRTLSLAAISHDLKTPLTRLRLQIEDAAAPDTKARMIADIAEMETMIDGTLTFLRGTPVDEPERLFDVSAMVDTICNNLIDQGHSVAVDGARHAIAVGHPLPIKRALTNLVENAVRHGGSARVHTAFEKFAIAITISDDGPGIQPDQLDLVRRPFQRLDTARSASTGGFGLGLTIAERLITAQGGTLKLVNLQPRGLEARVELNSKLAQSDGCA
jgi:two-component system, OmpR family, sensor kinase